MKTYNEIKLIPYEKNSIWRLFLVRDGGSICFATHWHDRLEFIHIISGCLNLYIDGEYMIAQPGQTVIISPYSNHSGIAGEDGVAYHAFSFDIQKFLNNSLASRHFIEPLTKPGIQFCPITEHPTITKCITELIEYIRVDRDNNPLCSMGKMYEIIGLFHQYCLRDSTSLHKTDEKFTVILKYISEHFTENISTKIICEKYGYDESYFCRRFKQLTGITPMKHIKNIRLEMAQDLLLNSDEDIKNIVWKCGFSNVNYFSTCFKQVYKMSPAQYRKLFKT